jgi:anaerobic magnesium-protoporphyrin IX monomethyl ester cyclase
MGQEEGVEEQRGRKRNTSQSFRNLFPIVQAEKGNPPIVWNRQGSNPRVLFVYHNDLEEGFIHPALAVLGGMMEQHGIESKLFDTSFWRDVNSPLVENDRQMGERVGEYKPVPGYNPEREVVNIQERFRKTVEEYRPDLIALTSTSYEFKSATQFIEPVKTEFGIPVIVGGPHATVAPDRAIASPAIDIVCIGDGEKSLLDLIRGINLGANVSEIPSLWLKDPNSGNVIKNPMGVQIEMMDDLPLPNWEMFDPRHRIRPFEGELKSYGYFEISRGCPFKCSYCIQPGLHEIPMEGGADNADSGNYKFHSAEEIVKRVAQYREKYGFNHLQLIDENLPTMPKKNLKEIAEQWARHVNPNRDLTIFTMSRPEYLVRKVKSDSGGFERDREGGLVYVSSGKAEVLREMGVEMVALGAESGNEWLRSTVLNRPMKQGILEAATRVLMESGIQVSLYNILGFPFETREMMFDTIDQMWKTKPNSYATRHLSPYPGTPIRDLCVEQGFIHPEYEDQKDAETRSFLHAPILNLPLKLPKEKVVVRNQITGEFEQVEHPSKENYIEHPSQGEQIRIRQLFGIYSYSPTKSMWPIIELAENRGLAKDNPELQNMVYEAFSRARVNRSEDDDAYRPTLHVESIRLEDVPWANGDEHLYVGRPRALLPIIELAGGRGYAASIPQLQDYVKKALTADIEERKALGIQDLSERRVVGGIAVRGQDEDQTGRIGFMATGRG